MTCNIEKCRHRKLILEAQKRCRACALAPGCEKDMGICPHRQTVEKARATCLNCNVEPSKISSRGVVHLESFSEIYEDRLIDPRTKETHGYVTSLPEEVEEKLGMFLHVLAGLDAFGALLLLHLANGGRTGSYGRYLSRTIEELSSYEPDRKTFRSTAHSRWKALCKSFAPFASLCNWKPTNCKTDARSE